MTTLEKNIANPTFTRKILKKYNLNLKKKMGQNFLIDQNILNKIIEAASIDENNTVIEIGSGIGSLTQNILKIVETGKVIGIEKDSRFINVLQNVFSENNNLELINKDVRDINWRDFLEKRKLLNRDIKVMGNLPYYITTPIIMGLLESDLSFSKLIFMVQKEVAERMVASPGNKDFGALSVGVQFNSKAEIIHTVPPDVFIPRPDVYSSIVALNPFTNSPYEVENEEFFFKIVKSIFQLRRKNIKNSIIKGSVLNISKKIVLEGLNRSGIDKKSRGEDLSIEKMIHFSNVLYNLIK